MTINTLVGQVVTRPPKQHEYILIGLHVTNTVTLLWVNWDGSDKTCSKTK